MSEITISEDAMRMIAQFENLTGAGARDCVVDDKFGRILFVINPGEMGLAIGKKGASIKKASDAFGKKVEVVEYNPDKVQFIRNCFLPVQVQTVTFEEDEEENTEVAYIEVADADRGLAIGKEGRNIIKAKKLAFRQFDIANVELKQEEEEESDVESPKACSSCGGTLVYFTPLVCKECKNYFGVESTTLAEVVGNLLQQTTDRIDKLEKQNASLQLAVEQLKSAMSAGGVALPDKETCCQAVKETPKEVLKETPKEVVAEAPKELQKEIPEEVPEEPLKEAEQTCKQTNNCATECKSSDSDDVTVLAEKFSSRQAAEEVLTLCHSNTANASKLSELFRYNHSQIKAAVNTFANDVQTVFKMLLVFGDNVSDTLEFVSKFGGNGVSAAAFMGSFADKDIAMVLLNFFSGDGVAAISFLDSFQRDGAAAVAFASCFEREKHLAQVVLKKFRGDGLLALKFQNHLTNNLNKTLEFLQVFSTGKDALTFLEQFKTIEEAMKMVAIFGGRGFDAASFMTIFKGDTSKAFLFLEKYSNNTHAALDTLHKFDNNVEKAIQFVNGFSDSDAATNLLEFFQNNSGMLEAYLKLVGIKDLTELYDTNKHEKSSAEFRRRVCGKGPTVTFVFGKKLLCGGVTFKSFEDTDDPELRSSDIFDDKCFLFSIMNPVLGLYPTKFDVKPDLADYAVRICPGSGPSFGYGVDLLTMFVDGRVECSSFPSSFPIEKESLFGPIGTNKCTATRVAVFSFNI